MVAPHCSSLILTPRFQGIFYFMWVHFRLIILRVGEPAVIFIYSSVMIALSSAMIVMGMVRTSPMRSPKKPIIKLMLFIFNISGIPHRWWQGQSHHHFDSEPYILASCSTDNELRFPPSSLLNTQCSSMCYYQYGWRKSLFYPYIYSGIDELLL